jgi:Cu-Zn family superoxide dismutase
VSKFFGTLALACVLVASAAVVTSSLAKGQDPLHVQQPTKAVAVIFPTKGNHVGGQVIFSQTDRGLRVSGEITGLAAGSKHGFHIHEFGDLSSHDGMAMGSHYNPTAAQHGLPDQSRRHVGDMGNITADAGGVAKIDVTFAGMSIGGHASVLGRGIIVHEKPDDGGQPVGNAGARIGQGVIGVAKA